jgi:uroporphyrin-III C-methyltransferase / precorrin-2 dehydrogenase / sirohydrochlorin ferrochelatase
MKMQNISRPQSNAARIAPLEVLPVFLRLDGKKAIVVGSSVGALWKAELLLQAGAHMTLICAEPDSSVFELLSRDWPGRLELCAEDWRNVPFTNAVIVIGDVSDDEAQEFYTKGREAFAIVNVVDNSEYCDVQFGSIVNQSPVVIGISTGGAAPVLAQLLRSFIETALPDKLQEIARKAQSIRQKVNDRLSTSKARRAYWSAFFARLDGSMAANTSGPYTIAKSDVQDLTVRDLAKLRAAEHIFLLPNANEKIAQLARREARWHRVIDAVLHDNMPHASVIVDIVPQLYGAGLSTCQQ